MAMERMEALAGIASAPLMDSFARDCDRVLSEAAKRKEGLIGDLKTVLETSLLQAEKLQRAGEKGVITYISFSMLQSNLLLERSEFRIDLYDEAFMIDDVECAGIWSFEWVFKCADDIFYSIVKKVRSSLPRVQEYEIQEMRRAYRLNYFAVAVELLGAILPIALAEVKTNGAKLAENVQITVGSYMERQQCINTWRPGS